MNKVLYIASKINNYGDRFEEHEKGVEVTKKSTSKFELIVGGITIIALLLSLFLISAKKNIGIMELKEEDIYTWPNPHFPFKCLISHPKVRVFIIENISHNYKFSLKISCQSEKYIPVFGSRRF